jgi:hypothetical protein
MMRVFVEGIGLRGDGLDGWTLGQRILNGAMPYVAAPLELPECALLPQAERRRAVPSVKLALLVGSEAVQAAHRDAATLETTFTSSAGDNRTLHETLQVLSTPERQVSPTRFHNSVHNAAAGYWHIATNSREASTSLACHDASFAAGLVDAASRVVTGAKPMLLVAYDLTYPEPLAAVRSLSCDFGAALVLTPEASERAIARLEIALCPAAHAATPMKDAALENMRAGNPAARSLPLLAALARKSREELVLEYVGENSLAIGVVPLESAARDHGDARPLQALAER